MVRVERWTGREVRALRDALKMSVRDFAIHANLAASTITDIEAKGEHANLRRGTQRMLDEVLATALEPAQQGFRNAIGQGMLHDPEYLSHEGSSGTWLDQLNSATVEGKDVKRRPLFAGGGAAIAGAVVRSPTAAIPGVARVAALLTDHSYHLEKDVEEAAVLHQSTMAKRDYQAGRYRQVVDALPRLLAGARAVCAAPQRLEVNTVVADVYQTACSVLLKLGEPGLALLAADHSVAAAERSGDLVAVAASSRALASALASNGHPSRGFMTAIAGARDLQRAGGLSATPALAVYGALLLRAAILAARGGDRATARGLLVEAQDAAARLDGDDNNRWTYFCAGNVTLHQVSVAVSLGDAGQAVEYAHQVVPDRIQLAERRACFYLDLTQAFTQWGRYEQAYKALRAAEHAAPQEVNRSAGRELVAELLHRCPPSLDRPLRQLADRIGTTA